MKTANYVLAIDIGTTGNKTCLYRITDKIELVDDAIEEYPLYLTDNGGAEQNPDDWWNAVCRSTRKVMKQARKVDPADIQGIAFCTQMQGMVCVDEEGTALRNAFSYMDSRGTRQLQQTLGQGPIRIADINARKAIKFLRITGGAPASPKDPLWKYLWVKDNEPEIYARTAKWLDVKEYLVHRCTGRFAMTPDSAFGTFLFDSRKGHFSWHKGLCRMVGVNPEHLPPMVESTDLVGGLTARAADEMGLKPGIPVFGGGGDASLIPVGAGCMKRGDTHIYVGTSGWASAVVEKRMVDLSNMIASVIGSVPQRFNYFAEQETSGICLQWVRDHLALDEIGVYLDARHVADKSDEYNNLYDFLNEVVEEVEPGSGGCIFTPWLRGNRCPFEDPYSRAMFFNVGLDTGKRKMIRAVLEGVAYHKRWMLESIGRKVELPDSLRFVGGGALSEVWCQIMADVIDRRIETTADPQNAGAVGAAVVCAVGLGLIDSFDDAGGMIPVHKTYYPRKQYREVYDRNYAAFRRLHASNKKAFALLNGPC